MAKLSPDKLPNCSATFTIYSISKTKLAAGNFSNQLSSTAENIINNHVAVAFFFLFRWKLQGGGIHLYLNDLVAVSTCLHCKFSCTAINQGSTWN
jgi:hypothetical protein